MGEDPVVTGRRQVVCQAAILGVVLVVRWPFPEPRWELGGGDEWAFVVHCLGFFSGDLNPHFFKYPTLHFYLTSVLYYLYYLLFSGENLEHFIAYRYFVADWDLLAIARGFNTLLAVATVAVVMAIGRRLYGRGGGLIAGTVLALMPLHVRFSHVAITDVPAAFWSALALWGAVVICQRGTRRDHIVAGMCAGLAGASKYPAALVLVPVLIATCSGVSVGRWVGMRWVVAAALLAFCVGTPYVYLDPSGFWNDFSDMGRTHLLGGNAVDAADNDFTWNYPLLYNLRYGLGWIGLLSTCAACIWRPLGWRRDECVLITGLAVFIAVLAIAESTYMRYVLLLTPILAVLVVRPLLGLIIPKWVRIVWVVALLAEPVGASFYTRVLLGRDDTRVIAREWMQQHLDQGRFVLALPTSDGVIDLLEPGAVYTRQIRYTKSFGEERLARAYDYLSGLDGLPHLYMRWNQEQIDKYIAPPEETVDSLLVLWYRHPLRVMGADSLVVQQTRWQVKIAAGSLHRAVFDRSGPPPGGDFLPVSGWSEIERNGPNLWIGWLPLRGHPRILPTTRAFFGVLRDFLVASEAVKRRDWQEALSRYRAVEGASVPLSWVLPETYVFQLHRDLGNICYGHLADPMQALQYWERARSLAPIAVETLVNLGIVYGDLGQTDRQRDCFNEALSLAPDHPQAGMMRQALVPGSR